MKDQKTPKTYMGHKIKETKTEKRIRTQGVHTYMIWDLTEEQAIAKGQSVHDFWLEYQALDVLEQNKRRQAHARRVEKEKEKKDKKKSK